MKLGELVFDLVVKGSSKKLDEANKKLKETNKLKQLQLKFEKVLNRELTAQEKNILKNAVAFSKAAGAIMSIGAAAVTALLAIDRMATSLSRANQIMINFQRQSGLSFGTLNKYAAAGAAVNFNSTEEGVANSLMSVQRKLRDFRYGRGDISPYQELQQVGGGAVDPWGKSAPQIIEELREAIKGVEDIDAVNIIERMGFSADDLLMLRMTKEEFEELSTSYFLSPQQREDMYKYSLELKKIHLRFEYLYKVVVLKLMKDLIPETERFTKSLFIIQQTLEKITGFVDKINKLSAIKQGLSDIRDIASILLNPFKFLYYILEDIAVYFLGGKSLFGLILEGLKDLTTINFSGFNLDNVVKEFSKLKDILSFTNPAVMGIAKALELLNRYEQKTNENISQTATPSIAYGGNSTTNNNANITNNVSVNTSRLPSEVIEDTPRIAFDLVQMQTAFN